MERLMFLSPRAITATMALLFVCSAAARSNQRAPDASAGIESLLNEARQAQHLPGLAVVVVRSEGPPRVYVAGERRIGKGDPLAPSDLMHLGSLTKAITATMIGALVEQQRMTLDTTIGQAFPELLASMQPGYRGVSVRQLLTHTAGVATYRTRQSLRPLLLLKGTGTEQRYAFVEQLVAEPPRFEAGARREYSNAGAAVAGAIAERISGTPYRTLVQDLVFGPLAGRAGFGNPGLAATSQPWGHVRSAFGTITEVSPDNLVYTTPLAIEAAGDISLSSDDYGRFLQLHLRGLEGRDDVLKATTIQALHRPGASMGWDLMPRGGVVSHEHVGSYGAFVAYGTIQPARDLAVAVFTNMGGGQDLRDAVGRLALRIATRLSGAKKLD
jgi:CubicO group peptidase (beta-lactamase class C family)